MDPVIVAAGEVGGFEQTHVRRGLKIDDDVDRPREY